VATLISPQIRKLLSLNQLSQRGLGAVMYRFFGCSLVEAGGFQKISFPIPPDVKKPH
jgi:hypothetical protein